jgi:type VI secretion system secreted protein Hcp
MPADMFLKLEGIPGESQDKKHAKEIDILAYGWGASQTGSFHSGGGGGAGKASFQDINFTKRVDVSSTKLLKAVAKGQHIGEAVFTVRKSGGEEPVEYLIITMKEVMVTAYAITGSKGEDLVNESFSLNFAKVEMKYTPQSATGGAGSKSTFGYNIKENTEL